MYRNVLLCMEMYGDVQGCMVMYRVCGDVQGCMVMYKLYGDVQGCMVMYRDVWGCIGVYGYVQVVW